ncbi:hypothetical protein DXG01_002327 [Tephrocybe rancida]|nr:hypothetical protein DXG01_002327 [Tephrocybe rancida]
MPSVFSDTLAAARAQNLRHKTAETAVAEEPDEGASSSAETPSVFQAPSNALLPPLPDQANTNDPTHPAKRARKFSSKYQDYVPKNTFGMFRHYQNLPTHDPESNTSADALSKIRQTLPLDRAVVYMPYPNYNAFKLGHWYWNEGAQKSQQSFKSLISIVGDKNFNPDDVRAVNWKKINTKLGLNNWDKDEWEEADAGWRVSSVSIQVPFHSNTAHPGVHEFVVKSFYHRSLVSVILEKLQQNKMDIPHFHLELYDLMWRTHLQKEPIRLHGKIYTSSSFAKAHSDLQATPHEPGCDLPCYVVALMFWSDGTHLTDFGTASLTPLYMQFGNDSKYWHCKPSAHLTEHLPDEFKSFASQYLGDGKNTIQSDLLSHCRWELAHAQLDLLLDKEFANAYQHGLVVEWDDGVARRFYPRILCYSADYKEKALLATVRCAIPMFDGLFDEPHDGAAVDLIFQFAHWHGLAKMRLHSDLSLAMLDEETTCLGDGLQQFQEKTCPSFVTCKLNREKEARQCRQVTQAKGKRSKSAPKPSSDEPKGKGKATDSAAPPEETAQTKTQKADSAGCRLKSFMLNGYKAHAIGDFTKTIKQFGTTDSYSTEPVIHV